MLSKRQRNVAVAVLLAIGATLLSWASTSTASYEVCQQERHASHPQQSGFLPEVRYFFVCEGVTLDANGVLITAMASVAIALFTLFLKRSTDKLWEAGERQIKALRQSVLVGIHAAKAAKRQSDAAHDTIEITKNQLRAVLTITSATPTRITTPTDAWIAALVFENKGNVSALQVRQFSAWRCGEDRLKDPFIGDEIFPVIDRIATETPHESRVVLARDEIPNTRPHLFLVGRIEYDDGFGRIETLSFTYILARDPLDPKHLRFQPYVRATDFTDPSISEMFDFTRGPRDRGQ